MMLSEQLRSTMGCTFLSTKEHAKRLNGLFVHRVPIIRDNYVGFVDLLKATVETISPQLGQPLTPLDHQIYNYSAVWDWFGTPEGGDTVTLRFHDPDDALVAKLLVG